MQQINAKTILDLAKMIITVLDEGTGPEIDDPAKKAALSVAKQAYTAKIEREAALTGMQLMLNKMGGGK